MRVETIWDMAALPWPTAIRLPATLATRDESPCPIYDRFTSFAQSPWLQAKYNDQIEVLMKQVEDLRSKRDTEVEGVLTPEQRDKLKTLQKDAAAKKADAKPDGKEGDK